MKLIISTFLAICLLSLSAFGQVEMAKKVYETGHATDCDVGGIIQNIRDTEFVDNTKAKLYIINHGTKYWALRRLIQLNKQIDFMSIDRGRVEFAPPIPNPFLMTEFWIVPEGAENPKPTIYAEKVNEFGNAMSGDLKFGLFSLTEKLDSNVLYICNFGTKREKSKRVKVISNLIKFLSFEKYGIQIIDGGISKTLKTEFWLVTTKVEQNEK
jgi:hypothetical protein